MQRKARRWLWYSIPTENTWTWETENKLHGNDDANWTNMLENKRTEPVHNMDTIPACVQTALPHTNPSLPRLSSEAWKAKRMTTTTCTRKFCCCTKQIHAAARKVKHTSLPALPPLDQSLHTLLDQACYRVTESSTRMWTQRTSNLSSTKPELHEPQKIELQHSLPSCASCWTCKH